MDDLKARLGRQETGTITPQWLWVVRLGGESLEVELTEQAVTFGKSS